LTILITLLSPSLAVVALIISVLGFRISQQALGVSQESLKVGQRAYIHAKIKIQNANVKEYPNRWLFSIEVINTGNTPARVTGITAKYEPESLPSVPDGWALGDVSQQTYVVGSKQSETVAFGSAMIDFPKPLPGYPPGGHLLPSVSVRYSYEDVFKEKHSDEAIKCQLMFDNGSISQPRCSTTSSDFSAARK
jgi:hypothetical protein